MITIEDRHGRPFECYADKPLIKRDITWATISPELKQFYREMSEKGILEFSSMLRKL